VNARHILILAAWLAGAMPAQAQDYPSRPIRVIVPYGAGGSSDGPMRVIAQEVSKHIGQQMVVENRPGQGAMIGSEVVARAPADGYTLLLASNPNAISASLYSNLSFNPVEDFAPITMLGREQAVLLAHPSLPAKTVQELIAMAKERPGKINYGSSGNGSAQHLFMALFTSMAGIQLTHIPYKGTGPAIVDLIGGRYDFNFAGLAGAVPQMRGGKLRGLAVTTPQRIASLPDIPAVAEAVPGYEVVGWYGVIGPAGMPAPIVAKLHDEIVRVLAMPDVRERIVHDGSDPVGNTPQEFRDFMTADLNKWAKLVKESGAKLD